MAPLLEVKDLHISFRTDAGLVQAVRGVSFVLEQGEVLGMVGESGCGKSVTSMALLGLAAQGQITQGQIIYQGQDLRSFSPKEWQRIRGKEIAMIFQDPMTSLHPLMTIGAQIIEILALHTALNAKERRHKAAALLGSVGLPAPESRLDLYPHHMSGGMRQRVMIAMALAASPKVLLADEPTTALDVTIQAQILDLLEALQRQEDISILLITHDLGIVANFCDRVHVMYAGRIVERATTARLFASPQHPYTEGLLRSIPLLDTAHHSLEGIPGQPPVLLSPPPGCAFAPRCGYAEAACHDQCPEESTVSDTQVACFHPTTPRQEERP